MDTLVSEHVHQWRQWNAELDYCVEDGCQETRRQPAPTNTVEMRVLGQSGDHKDEGKPEVQYLDPGFLEDVGRVFGFGARKYAPWNYQKGIAYTRLVGSVLRHMFAFMRREDMDPESGLPHLAHAGASLQMLYFMWRERKERDDRP